MRSDALPEVVIQYFEYYFKLLTEGKTGDLPEKDIWEVTELPDADLLENEYLEKGNEAFPHTVTIKLNGGLGTNMGLECAKSLLKVKNGLTFLDIIAKQAVKTSVPLVLMNSFATRKDSLDQLQKHHSDLRKDIPLDFTQHRIPKIRRSDLTPAEYPENPVLEWCPPGHGDIYAALITSGLLNTLIERGYKTAFISNSDNLGAYLDPEILGFFVSNNYGFMMEVADRTPSDRKGGHLARLKDRECFVLRESAQCPAEDKDHFQDIKKHRFFNTNNLWINLGALRVLLDESDGYLKLPLIRNEKTVNPADPSSYPVYQLETAMGAAISVFKDSQAIRVARNRFFPVKTTDDFLLVTSDATILTDQFLIEPAPQRQGTLPTISLDPACYKMIPGLKRHFPFGSPSLINCDSFRITGSIRFGRNVIIRGETEITNHSGETVDIADGTVLEGNYSY